MPNSEERMKVLKMVQEGKLTAEEGIHLLEALEGSKPKNTSNFSDQQPGSSKARWLRVRITDTDTGKTRVNIRLPISVVTAGAKMGARFSTEVEGMDMEQLLSFVRTGETGQVVDLYDDEDGEHVEVYVE